MLPLLFSALALAVASGSAAQAPGLPPIDVVVQADKSTYRPGEPIGLTLHVVNRSGSPITLEFRTAQRYDVVVQDRQGQERWRWSADHMFAQVLGEERLPAHGGWTQRITLRAPLTGGEYTVVGIVPVEGGSLSGTTLITVK